MTPSLDPELAVLVGDLCGDDLFVRTVATIPFAIPPASTYSGNSAENVMRADLIEKLCGLTSQDAAQIATGTEGNELHKARSQTAVDRETSPSLERWTGADRRILHDAMFKSAGLGHLAGKGL
jgi:hypothetical protein